MTSQPKARTIDQILTNHSTKEHFRNFSSRINKSRTSNSPKPANPLNNACLFQYYPEKVRNLFEKKESAILLQHNPPLDSCAPSSRATDRCGVASSKKKISEVSQK
ncbi:hypothetical protein NPIL_56951 [Nephila pilipes]|uniref:Uncharacterized protein n=1 Tax=Nephila pilipes TaxID=299642 RepID=A0A8X6MYJ8_NEPPI|nr:hypothetical protein NPIL_56951 [Nephila pilipes]